MSKKVWVVSDTHFGHEKILGYEKIRGDRWKSVLEMDEELVALWNDTVSDGDRVYHLGDFGFGKDCLKVVRQLKGHKVLVMGNHDKFEAWEYVRAGFEDVKGVVTMGKEWVMTHIPIISSELRWKLNIHGHLHSGSVGLYDNEGEYLGEDPRYRCVSVERTGFRPVELESLLV